MVTPSWNRSEYGHPGESIENRSKKTVKKVMLSSTSLQVSILAIVYWGHTTMLLA